jgi:hypothetical protein
MIPINRFHIRLAISLVAIGCLFPQAGHSQETDGDKIIFQAMQDELKRSMDELSYERFDKPFFISYRLSDLKSWNVLASLGAVMRSNDAAGRGKTVRLLVGNYEFNDESVDNDIFSFPQANEIDVPMENDYLGIRRAYWVTTDNVYKNAARHYDKNKATLAESKKPLADLPHRTFAKMPAFEKIITAPALSINKADLEKYVRDISAAFKSNHHINASSVVLNFVNGHDYFVNSEGTRVKYPQSLAMLQITAQYLTDNGESAFEQMVHFAISPDKLPSADQMKAEVSTMLQRLDLTPSLKPFDDDYFGPVLFIGDPAAEVFASSLFSEREGLIASNNLPSLTGYRYENTGLDAKIGKSILSESVTVKTMPLSKKYGNTDLLGSFEVDDDGVPPVNDLILIENGILKTLLHDRSLLQKDQVANGYGSGPGVVSVSVKQGVSAAVLKDKLIAKAKEDGLEYALIVRELPVGKLGLLNVYKVSVKDGKEELLRSASMAPVTLRDLKKLLGASADSFVYHAQIRGSGGNGLTSFIVPQAILLEELNLRHAEIPVLRDETYVESPLKN